MTSVDAVVLGAGPAGLMAALRLVRTGRSCMVLERSHAVGGMAGSREIAGVRVDFGSHRLHPVVAPYLQAELERLLGSDLQPRQRHGRIALGGRWLKFPLQIGDLARNMPKPLVARIGWDTATSAFRRPKQATAAEVLAARLGPTVAQHFYTPYLKKLWDTAPEQLAVELADRRVSARSGMSIIRKALRIRKAGGYTFLYPKRGYGQISEAIADAAVEEGADIRLDTLVRGVRLCDDSVEVETGDGGTVRAATALSTIPLPVLASLAGAPSGVLEAGGRLRHRAMVLLYLVFGTDQLTPFDAHYFPELNTPVSRMSEPKNFRDGDDPDDVTVLCAEVPCWEGDDTWSAAPDELAASVMATLEPLGFRFPPLLEARTEKLPKVYPVYAGSYVDDLAQLENWATQQPRVLTFGRQGLFTPDNTHHALHMGWEAADVVQPDGRVDLARWRDARESFRSYVVED